MSQYLGKTSLAYARVWHHVDMAKEPRTLGRLASSIAQVLVGKHKPIFHPSTDCGDYVVVTNCRYINVTGKKMETKEYFWHTGRPGHSKTMTMEDMIKRKGGGEVLRKAVSGMLPKNRLRKFRIERLKTFEGSRNEYAQNVFASYDMQPAIRAHYQRKASAAGKTAKSAA